MGCESVQLCRRLELLQFHWRWPNADPGNHNRSRGQPSLGDHGRLHRVLQHRNVKRLRIRYGELVLQRGKLHRVQVLGLRWAHPLWMGVVRGWGTRQCWHVNDSDLYCRGLGVYCRRPDCCGRWGLDDAGARDIDRGRGCAGRARSGGTVRPSASPAGDGPAGLLRGSLSWTSHRSSSASALLRLQQGASFAFQGASSYA